MYLGETYMERQGERRVKTGSCGAARMAARLGAAVLAAALTFAVVVTGVGPAEDGAASLVTAYADETYTADSIRAEEEAILDFRSGGKVLLSGDILDHAGDSASDWYVYSAARLGRPGDYAAYGEKLTERITDVYSNFAENTRDLLPSELDRWVIMAEVCGLDATAIGEGPDGEPINLVDQAVWHCAFGDPGLQGVNGYVWALVAADSGAYPEPEDAEWTRASLITAILAEQQEGGGYALDEADTADPDITAMVLTALAPYASDTTVYSGERYYSGEPFETTVPDAAAKAFEALSACQMSSGAISTYGKENAESTSWALNALAAWSIDAQKDDRFIKDNNTLLDGLFGFKLEGGGFTHVLDVEEGEELKASNIATYEALYGLESTRRQMAGEDRLFDLTSAEVPAKEEAGADSGAVDGQNDADGSGADGSGTSDQASGGGNSAAGGEGEAVDTSGTDELGVPNTFVTDNPTFRTLIIVVPAVAIALIILIIVLNHTKKSKPSDEDEW